MHKIIHFHFETEQNIGDEAHVLAIQAMITRRLPDPVQFIDLPIEMLSMRQIPPVVPGAHRLPALLQRTYRRVRHFPSQGLLHQLNSADMVVIGGGGVFIGPLLPFDKQLIRRICPPIVIYGAGYNRNAGTRNLAPAAIASIQTLGDKAALVSVRDEQTQEFLDKLTVPSELIGDPAIFLQPAQNNNRPPRSEKTVRIGLNIAMHGWSKQQELMPDIIRAYTEAIRALGKVHDVEIYYFMHHPAEGTAIDMLRNNGVHITRIVQGRSPELVAAYGEVDCTIAMMLHSTILAFGQDTPAINIGYDIKNRAFMQLTGQEKRYIDVEHLTTGQLVKQATALLSNLMPARIALAAHRQPLRQASEAFAMKVIGLLVPNYDPPRVRKHAPPVVQIEREHVQR